MRSSRILILEEEYLIAEDLHLYLRDCGFNVAVSFSVPDALEKALAFNPHLLILGAVTRGTENESDVAKRVQAALAQPLNILFLVSRPISADGFAKNSRFLLKPFRNEEMLQIVKQLMNRET